MITYKNEISIEEYNELRSAVNWIKVNENRAKKALNNSYYKVIAYEDGKAKGMARIVSDGGYTYFITDVIVRPDCQGKGIGTRMIDILLEYIRSDVGENETVMISLMSAYERESFYERFGFHKRPYGNHGSGMSMWLSVLNTGEILKS